MPETHEAEAHRKLVDYLFNKLSVDGADFHLLGIWADGMEKEQGRAPAESRLRAGHVYKLTPDSKIKRSSRKNQTPMFPPMYGSKPRAKIPPPSIEGLKLKGIHPGARSITLDFGEA